MSASLNAPPIRPAALLASLCVGRLTLAVPLRDLQSLEPVLDVDVQNRGGASAGTIDLRTGRCPVYCIDESLAVLTDPRPEHRICAILEGGDAGPFGLICSAVEALEGDGLASVGVPPCMRTSGSPLEGLTLHGRRVLCRTTGAALARFMTAGAPGPAGAVGGELTHILVELDPGMDEDCT
jgi:hypothetical protein